MARTKPIPTLVAEIRRSLDEIESKEYLLDSDKRDQHIKNLEAENEYLKKEIKTAQNSQSQYKGMFEKEQKKVFELERALILVRTELKRKAPDK